MRLKILVIWIAVSAALNSRPAEAFDKNARRLGLGLEIGDPTGLSAKYYLNRQSALQGGFGFFGWPSGGGIHVDYVYEFTDLVTSSREGFTLPLFVGGGIKAGGVVRCKNGGIDRRECHTDPFAGLRVPVGAALQLRQSPLELQLELAPVFYSPFFFAPFLFRFGVEADLALAVRYYF